LRSPCIDLCKFDRKTGWCLGCARTKDECRTWKKAKKSKLKKILSELPGRLQQLQN
jgi:predicted Fe-S protein YdhL (DUF1289 family)